MRSKRFITYTRTHASTVSYSLRSQRDTDPLAVTLPPSPTRFTQFHLFFPLLKPDWLSVKGTVAKCLLAKLVSEVTENAFAMISFPPLRWHFWQPYFISWLSVASSPPVFPFLQCQNLPFLDKVNTRPVEADALTLCGGRFSVWLILCVSRGRSTSSWTGSNSKKHVRTQFLKFPK